MWNAAERLERRLWDSSSGSRSLQLEIPLLLLPLLLPADVGTIGTPGQYRLSALRVDLCGLCVEIMSTQRSPRFTPSSQS